MHTAPTPDDIVERVQVLFGAVCAGQRSEAPLASSPYASSAPVESFDILIPQAGEEPTDPEKAATVWLNTPNPTFGGRCPKQFIHGTDKQRAFFAGILSSLEDGAFF